MGGDLAAAGFTWGWEDAKGPMCLRDPALRSTELVELLRAEVWNRACALVLLFEPQPHPSAWMVCPLLLQAKEGGCCVALEQMGSGWGRIQMKAATRSGRITEPWNGLAWKGP